MLHQILLGGDQLTVARCRGCQIIRINSVTQTKKLCGLHPVIEDWHAKVTLLEVCICHCIIYCMVVPVLINRFAVYLILILLLKLHVVWKRLHNTLSATDHGTLQQLRNLINRRNTITDPSRDVNACEDYFILVVTCHALCAAMKVEHLQQFPDGIEDEWNLQTKEKRRKKLYSVASLILTKFVDLSTFETTDVGSGSRDYIHEYAKEIISLGVLYMEYQDAIREGDGNRVFNCWKYLMIIFKATGRKNYALEAFTLLAQYERFLPPRQSKQLKFSRFVNVHGRPGCNVSCDLYMEHLNKMVKSCMQVATSWSK